ncbi:MAG: 2-oxo acid dehydrogenase subunit E2 [Tissierellia bacterium]|nr:2-oxo acid dehydrogenase subunit E2 [Tissierellia bacterium]
MSFELVMPRAGLTMVEGTIVSWKVEEGAQIKKGEPVLEIENEKTIMDVESTADGFLHITAQAGEIIPVGERIGIIAESKEEYNKVISTASEAVETSSKEATPAKTTEASKEKATAAAVISGQRVRATGLAKKIAKEAGIDLSQVTGTGPNNRIVAKDVNKFIEDNAAAATLTQLPQEKAEVIPWVGVRRTIANTMYESLQSMAQTTATVEVDVSKLTEMRKNLVEKEDFLACRITINDLLCMAAIKTAKKHPLANATFDGNALTTYPYVNLSVAVAAEHGLMVPVVKYADSMTLTQLNNSLKDYAERARDGKLLSGEQSEGTITVTNVGMFPIDHATPVINPPQTTIIGFGRSVKKMVVVDDEPCIRTMMNVFITYDHRVYDGLEVGRILATIKEYIENPELIMA